MLAVYLPFNPVAQGFDFWSREPPSFLTRLSTFSGREGTIMADAFPAAWGRGLGRPLAARRWCMRGDSDRPRFVCELDAYSILVLTASRYSDATPYQRSIEKSWLFALVNSILLCLALTAVAIAMHWNGFLQLAFLRPINGLRLYSEYDVSVFS